jgi:hypothetical protein
VSQQTAIAMWPQPFHKINQFLILKKLIITILREDMSKVIKIKDSLIDRMRLQNFEK